MQSRMIISLPNHSVYTENSDSLAGGPEREVKGERFQQLKRAF